MSKFYAIRKGIGGSTICTDWKTCETRVKGFKGAEYKSFTTLKAANEYLYGNNIVQNSNNNIRNVNNGVQNFYKNVITTLDTNQQVVDNIQQAYKLIDYVYNQTNHILCYTDGSSHSNPGPSGSAVLIQWPGRQFETTESKFLGTNTNNYAELYAIELCLTDIITISNEIKDGRITNISLLNSEIYILTDSQYSEGVLVKGWNSKKNQDLIAKIKNIIATCGFTVRIGYIPAHKGIPGNERVNELANKAVLENNK